MRLAALRAELDNAITYGSGRGAMAIALEGVDVARRSEDLGELAYFKGQILMLDGRFALAMEHFDRAISLNPFDGASYNDRALCMVELGQERPALAYFDRGIEAEPDYATIYHNKGWLLNRLDEPAAALRCFRRALDLEPSRAVTYENMAASFIRLGCYADALDAYRRAVDRLGPHHDDIREQLIAEMRRVERRLENGQRFGDSTP